MSSISSSSLSMNFLIAKNYSEVGGIKLCIVCHKLQINFNSLTFFDIEAVLRGPLLDVAEDVTYSFEDNFYVVVE